MQEGQVKLLKLMRFWLFGTFMIILTAQMVVALQVPGLMQETNFWLGLVAAAVLCVAWYFVYRGWLMRRGS